MKHLLFALALGAASLTVSAQGVNAVPATGNVVAPGVNAPHYNLAAPKNATWPRDLIGTWASPGSDTMSPGSLTLTAAKGLTMAPKDMYVLKGYWYVESAGQLVFDTPIGVSKAKYSLDSKSGKLALSYANGQKQEFNRIARAHGQTANTAKPEAIRK